MTTTSKSVLSKRCKASERLKAAEFMGLSLERGGLEHLIV
jgi:hypothetical protein